MMSVPSSKTITGAAIRMVPLNGNILGVAEGLETAASAFRATGIATWATISAHGMETVVIPEGIDTVLIWADKDKSLRGEQAAEVLTDRLKEEGIRAITLLPATPIPKGGKSIDWNDVLVQQGLFGFPRRNELLRYAQRPSLEQGIA